MEQVVDFIFIEFISFRAYVFIDSMECVVECLNTAYYLRAQVTHFIGKYAPDFAKRMGFDNSGFKINLTEKFQLFSNIFSIYHI